MRVEQVWQPINSEQLLHILVGLGLFNDIYAQTIKKDPGAEELYLFSLKVN